MSRQILVTAGFLFPWTFSPDALTLLGNAIGAGGLLFLPALAAGALLSALAILLLHHRTPPEQAAPNPYQSLTAGLGPVPALTLILAGRLPVVLLLPTGMLVSAGFVWNEAFFHSFPNFAFSALLLLLVLSLHLAGERLVVAGQILFLLTTLACLLLLTGVGLLSGGLPAGTVTANLDGRLVAGGISTALLLFLGYGLAPPGRAAGSAEIVTALAAGALLYALWTLASLANVHPDRLAASSLPHLLTAREILDQPGRLLMAVAIISGTGALVNGLFFQTSTALRQLAAQLPRPTLVLPVRLEALLALFYSIAIAAALAAGLAGSDALAVYIHGSLLLWLLLTAALCFTAGGRLRRLGRRLHLLSPPLGTLFLLAILWSAATAAEAARLGSFCLLVLTTVALLSLFLSRLFAGRDKGGKGHDKSTNQHRQGE